MFHSRFRVSVSAAQGGTATRHIDGPMIGFQHLVTVTNTDSAVRRMLLSTLPSSLSASRPSQLAQPVAADAMPYPGSADDETCAPRSPIDSSQAEMQGAMEVSAAFAAFAVLQLTMCRTCPLRPPTTVPRHLSLTSSPCGLPVLASPMNALQMTMYMAQRRRLCPLLREKKTLGRLMARVRSARLLSPSRMMLRKMFYRLRPP